jgi:3-hydroxyisobutyrate dehydrogenase-like beta-hydroxyacid dehydrogenase
MSYAVASDRIVGLLHPGEMGASVGGSLIAQGVRVLWASEGRSEASHRRARLVGLEDAGSLGQLVATADLILCICPPHAALGVAVSVAAVGFTGLYIDCNAVAPGTARNIQCVVDSGGARFADGSLIGGPPRAGGSTRLYLSGPEASAVAELFAGTNRLEAVVLDGKVAAASSLKMCSGAWTKGTAALLLAVRAVARATGVEEPLLAEWERSQPDLVVRTEAARRSAPKAWRFAGEMDEIARGFTETAAAGAGFPAAAAEVFRTLSDLKGTEVDLEQLQTALIDRTQPPGASDPSLYSPRRPVE